MADLLLALLLRIAGFWQIALYFLIIEDNAECSFVPLEKTVLMMYHKYIITLTVHELQAYNEILIVFLLLSCYRNWKVEVEVY